LASSTKRSGSRATRPKAKGKSRSKAGIPSREDVLAFIAEHPGKAGKRDIGRAFGVTGSGRIELKKLLKSLADDGLIEGRKTRLNRTGDLPSVTVLEITGRDRDGEFLALPTTWSPELGDPPIARVQLGRNVRGRAIPGVGDRILARLSRHGEPGVDYDASVIKVLPREPKNALGVLTSSASGWRIEPVDRKQKSLMLDGEPGKAKEGDLVTIRTVRESRYGLKQARIANVVASTKSEKAISLIAIHTHDIPYNFAADVLAESEAATPASPKGREDWRDLPLVTIDPHDAKDHDDAVHAAPDTDPANPGGHVVTVAIADVASYVRPGSSLDRSALERGNSVYFPDRVVPMLPERISNDLCSLRAAVDRPALAVRMVFSKNGRKKRHGFFRIMMRSAASLSYEQAQRAFDGQDSGLKPGLVADLEHLWRAYRTLARERDDRAPLNLDLPERKVILDKAGHIDRIVVPPRLEAHRLIEEFMIQANVAAAETLEAKNSPLVYRIHDTPSLAKLEALRGFLKSIELSVPKSGNLRPEHFNRILSQTRDSEHSQVVSEVVLRTQSQAAYSPQNIGHFGLNLRRYAHFTSPIRRYADLLVHRALVTSLGLGSDGLREETAARLPEIAAQISAAERRAMMAERDTIDRLVAHWLAERVGATFTGRISGVTRSGLFVRLDETGADGFIPMSTLGGEYFHFDEAAHAVIGEQSGETHRLGDAVEVRLAEAIPLTGGLRFELLSEGRKTAKAARPRRRSGVVGGKRAGGANRSRKRR